MQIIRKVIRFEDKVYQSMQERFEAEKVYQAYFMQHDTTGRHARNFLKMINKFNLEKLIKL